MTKSRTRRTASGYKASVVWVNPARDGDALSSFGTPCRVDPTGPGEEGTSYLERSPALSSHIGLPLGQLGGTGQEKSAEAIVAQPGEGPNL